ncbi:hypothetical protein HDV57DRAFT_263208 [Trichoderma longibrachiatum]
MKGNQEGKKEDSNRTDQRKRHHHTILPVRLPERGIFYLKRYYTTSIIQRQARKLEENGSFNQVYISSFIGRALFLFFSHHIHSSQFSFLRFLSGLRYIHHCHTNLPSPSSSPSLYLQPLLSKLIHHTPYNNTQNGNTKRNGVLPCPSLYREGGNGWCSNLQRGKRAVS